MSLDIPEDARGLAAWAHHAAIPPSAQLLFPFTGAQDSLSFGDLSVMTETETSYPS